MRGGGNIEFIAVGSACSPTQHDIDVGMAQQASAYLRRKMRAVYAQGLPSAERVGSFSAMLRDILRKLAKDPFSTMSPKQRRIVEMNLLPSEIARIRALHIRDAAPEVLRVLPMRPPHRRHELETAAE